jgi:hypothetical protein
MSSNPEGNLPAGLDRLRHLAEWASAATPAPIDSTVIKSVLVEVLSFNRHGSAADAIEDATFSLTGNILKIQTKLSRVMLSVVVNPDAERHMAAALRERGYSHKIDLLPAPSKATNQKLAKASASLLRLKNSSAELNTVSDQLTKQIEQLDAALKRLNLGVATWVTISEDEDGNCSQEYIGYVRIGSRWGIALRTCSGVRGDPSPGVETFSAFADAPRQLRLRAVEYIPQLLDQLSSDAEAMVAKLSPKVEEITELTRIFQGFNEVSIGRDVSQAIRKTERRGETSEVKK